MPLPTRGALLRASTIAQPTPKIVFSGTAITAISTDSQNALTAAGVVMNAQAVPMPCSNVRPNTIASGSEQQQRQVQQRDAPAATAWCGG